MISQLIVVLFQTLSGTIFITVGQNVLQNKPKRNLDVAFPSGSTFDVSQLTTMGATELRSVVPAGDLHTVIVAYNNALTRVFLVAVVMSALTIVGSSSVEWKNIKQVKKQQEQQQS